MALQNHRVEAAIRIVARSLLLAQPGELGNPQPVVRKEGGCPAKGKILDEKPAL
jgi:hypothetical protein